MERRIDEIELLSYQECCETVDRQLLAKQLEFVMSNSPFYSDKFRSAGFSGTPSIDSFSDLPFTDKREIIDEQTSYPPFGRLAVGNDGDSLRRIHVTSGSTGRPVYIILTENDVKATVEAGRRTFKCAGLMPSDTVIHCLNYCMWAGGLTDHLSLEATGAAVIPYGVGNSRNLIQTILDMKPTAISCTPSYLSRLEHLLLDEFGMTPPDLGLQKAFLGGEGGLQNQSVRSRIENTWRIRAVDANYGMADVLSMFGSECDARQGLHFHGQGILFFELIDPESLESVSVETDNVGEMVLTNLAREAQPLVRYKTGDVVRIVSTEQCACGRKSFRFVVEGRSDDMIVVRGINVFPGAVGQLLADRSDWFSSEYQIVLDTPPPYERPLLRVELSRKFEAPDTESLGRYIVNKCHRDLNFTPRIEFLRFGRFPRSDGKTKRVVKLEG